MRHGTPNRRSRNNRGHNGGGHRGGNGAPNRAQVFDSNGPDVRIRGTAYQIVEKYMALAKDSASVGDVVMAESYLQHAEHYQRVINEWGYQNPVRNDQAQSQPTDAATVRPIAGEGPQPSADDLGLPSSILGAKREVKSEELADA